MGESLTVSSPDFAPGESIPQKFTCDGAQVNPTISIAGVPSSTKSIAFIMDDPDVPKAVKSDGVFDHWTLYNIPASGSSVVIREASTVGTVGQNGTGKSGYVGPCPPREYEPSEHRYFFRAYALDVELSLAAGASKAEVLKSIEGHILAEGELMGRYKRP